MKAYVAIASGQMDGERTPSVTIARRPIRTDPLIALQQLWGALVEDHDSVFEDDPDAKPFAIYFGLSWPGLETAYREWAGSDPLNRAMGFNYEHFCETEACYYNFEIREIEV